MPNPLISVIIPNFNHARYLNERIDSILAQTYQNFELIILDDCSTDNSREVIEQYRDNPHVSHIVYNETNSGSPFKQWIKGIELAKGEYCYIAESDDSCRPKLLEKLVKQAISNDEIAMVMCRTFFTDENLNIKGGLMPISKPKVYTSRKFISKFMAEGNEICNAGMVLFRREDALRINRQFLDPIFAGAGDYVFWLEMAKCGRIALVNEPLNYFRRSPLTVTSRREIDGSNSRARHLILKQMIDEGYISKYRIYNVHDKEIRDINSIEEMNHETRASLLKLWGLSKCQLLYHKYISLILRPFNLMKKCCIYVISPNKWHFRRARVLSMNKNKLTANQFADLYYN